MAPPLVTVNPNPERQSRNGDSGGILSPVKVSRSKSAGSTRGMSTQTSSQPATTSNRPPAIRTSPQRGREVGRATHRAVHAEDDQHDDQLAATPSSSRDESTNTTPQSEQNTDNRDSGTETPATPLTPVYESESAYSPADQHDDPDGSHDQSTTSSTEGPPLLTLAVTPPRPRQDRPRSSPVRAPQVTFARAVSQGQSTSSSSRPRAVAAPEPRPRPVATPLPRRAVSTGTRDTGCGQGRQGVSAVELGSGTNKQGINGRCVSNGRQHITFGPQGDNGESRYFHSEGGSRGKSTSLSPDQPFSDEEMRPSGRLAAKMRCYETQFSQGEGRRVTPPPVFHGLEFHASPAPRTTFDDIQIAKALNALTAHRGGPDLPAMVPSYHASQSTLGADCGGNYPSAIDRYPGLYCPPGGACPIDPGQQTQQVYMVGMPNRGGNSQYVPPPPNPYVHPGVAACQTRGAALRAPNAAFPPQPPAAAINNIQRVKGKEAKLPKYDPKEAFEMYLQRYELAADYNGWDEMERAAQLVFLLQPAEFQTVRNIQVRIPGSYRLIVDALTQQYGASNNRIRSLAIFRNRRQQQHETLMTFSLALKGLAEFAYPLMDEGAREGLAMDHFVRNVADQATSKLLLQDNTLRTLNDAVNKAVIIESAETEANANKPRAAAARYDRYPNVMTVGRDVNETRAEIAQLTRQVGELRHDVQTRVTPKMEPKFDPPVTRARAFTTASTANERVTIICFRCGIPGHIAKMCRGKRSNADAENSSQPDKRQYGSSYPRDAPRAENDQRAATPNARTADSANSRLHGGQ